MITSMLLWMAMLMCLSATMNPVKLTINLVVFSMMSFFIMFTSMASAWFPMIFLLLFTGGILMMFMILSSIMPNEKALKFSKTSQLTLMILALSLFNMNVPTAPVMAQAKWFMTSSSTFQSAIMLITMYFLSFTYILCNSKEPMRSYLCRINSTFVKFL